MVNNNYRFKACDFEIFAGLDVSKKSIAMTFVSDGDNNVRSLKMPYDSAALIRYVDKHFRGKRIAFVYEAGPTGFGLHDDLAAAGHYCMVTPPSMVPKAPGEKVKTNRLDSRKLAEQLRGQHLRAVRIPTDRYRQLRHLTQFRRKCVNRRTAVKLQIKSLLLVEEIAFPVNGIGKSCWSEATLEQLACLSCGGAIRFKLDRLLCQLKFWHQEVLQVQKEARRFCRHDPELSKCVQLMTTVSGIGETIAIYLLSRIGDWRLLKNSRELASFFGLTPSEYSTGEKVKRGPITRMGDRLGRALLIEAAWVSIRKDPELKECFRRIFDANNKDKDAAKIAIVAVARRLTSRIYAVLSQQRPYLVKKGNAIVAAKSQTVEPRANSSARKKEIDSNSSAASKRGREGERVRSEVGAASDASCSEMP